jgi:hypothetical protein
MGSKGMPGGRPTAIFRTMKSFQHGASYNYMTNMKMMMRRMKRTITNPEF